MDKLSTIDELKQCYYGYFLKDPVGNNAFSFDQRQCKEIYIPSLIGGNLEDVNIGTESVFSEIVDGEERRSFGLEYFIHWQVNGKDVFIFDNHNHAFSFWSFGLKSGAIAEDSTLIHIDQHKDTRQPDEYLAKGFWKKMNFDQITAYVNRVLNVGNFIDPALKAGMFRQLVMVDHEQAFEQRVNTPCIADIDLDIFSPEMDYISRDQKVLFIRDIIQRSSFVTIATSPYFMDQDSAIRILKDLFRSF